LALILSFNTGYLKKLHSTFSSNKRSYFMALSYIEKPPHNNKVAGK